MKPIRNSVKAIIINEGSLLAIELRDEQGTWYQLPGGGQRPGETMHQALIRECREETNAAVAIGELRFIREYIGKNHEFSASDADTHQIDFMFACKALNPDEVRMGAEPDTLQRDVRWLDLGHLNEHRLYPLDLRKHLMSADAHGLPVYFGDIN